MSGGHSAAMRVPPSQPPLAPLYLDLLQNRRLPQSATGAGSSAPGRPTTIDAGNPAAATRLPRGSLVDIKA
jgi:hypothetical protein